ncbi:DNA repair exonuclease [Fodinicurvata sp. EGI_FJ10296]|uniref:metallophosphoesterase family protein n=1 Tax=Fodinicurvata sp. EGI_FJ10296 TaxID=3231908 RepID=UPI003453F235
MARFSFLHAADLHLDTPFAGVGRLDDRLAERLRDASLAAWDRLVQTAIDRHVDFLVLAGDIYDGAERGLRAQLRFRDGCARLSAKNIPIFIIHGNHDPLGGWSAVREWPQGVTIFAPDEVTSQPVERDGERLATIHGISYDRPDVRENLALRFPADRQPADGFTIGMLHCSVGDVGDHATYAPCSLDDLRSRAIDYWALGHVHGQAVLHEHPYVVYPGCAQGRSPKPGETGEKGAILVTVAGGQVSAIDPVPLAEIVFDDIALDISDIDGIDALIDTLTNRAVEQARRTPGGAILTARLGGSGAVHDDLRRPGARQDLLKRLRETTAAPDGRLIWWRDLRDDTTATIDWDILRERDDLVGEIVRRGDHLLSDANEAEALANAVWQRGDNLARSKPDADERARLFKAAIRQAVLTLENDR